MVDISIRRFQPSRSVINTLVFELILFPGVKRPKCEADNSLPSCAEVKNAWSYTSALPYVFMEWYLVNHGDKFTYTLPAYSRLVILSTL